MGRRRESTRRIDEVDEHTPVDRATPRHVLGLFFFVRIRLAQTSEERQTSPDDDEEKVYRDSIIPTLLCSVAWILLETPDHRSQDGNLPTDDDTFQTLGFASGYPDLKYYDIGLYVLFGQCIHSHKLVTQDSMAIDEKKKESQEQKQKRRAKGDMEMSSKTMLEEVAYQFGIYHQTETRTHLYHYPILSGHRPQRKSFGLLPLQQNRYRHMLVVIIPPIPPSRVVHLSSISDLECVTIPRS
ncbi:hypothetical protein PNOK_0497200 [Pyrrhoderma noxium]|uniref:Uncharacterized protein n=1 Tax=Pyrrhoderma noxium TaxID=2282107 RepID=A0A286UKE2_9AGAM|nr:hypothetical protein PNOK_0497200 [Pyrrhoderma noxium]